MSELKTIKEDKETVFINYLQKELPDYKFWTIGQTETRNIICVMEVLTKKTFTFSAPIFCFVNPEHLYDIAIETIEHIKRSFKQSEFQEIAKKYGYDSFGEGLVFIYDTYQKICKNKILELNYNSLTRLEQKEANKLAESSGKLAFEILWDQKRKEIYQNPSVFELFLKKSRRVLSNKI